MLFIFLTLLSVVSAGKDHLLPHCQLPLHHGVKECSNVSSIRFHMDVDSETCLAFKYSGCGGNANNFESLSECHRCLPMDYSTCPMVSQRVPNNNGKTTCGGLLGKCDGPNAYCQMNAFFGTCCDKKIKDKQSSDYDKLCGPNSQKHQIEAGGFNLTLLGKTCDSKFCPSGTTCHQGNFFAYCCH